MSVTFNVELHSRDDRALVKEQTRLIDPLVDLVFDYLVCPGFSKVSQSKQWTAAPLTLPAGELHFMRQQEHEVFFRVQNNKGEYFLVVIDLMKRGEVTKLLCTEDDEHPKPGEKNPTLARHGDYFYFLTLDDNVAGTSVAILNRWIMKEGRLNFSGQRRAGEMHVGEERTWLQLEFDGISRSLFVMVNNAVIRIDEEIVRGERTSFEARYFSTRIKQFKKRWDLLEQRYSHEWRPWTQPYSSNWLTHETPAVEGYIECHGAVWFAACRFSTFNSLRSICCRTKNPLVLRLHTTLREEVATLLSTSAHCGEMYMVCPAQEGIMFVMRQGTEYLCYYMQLGGECQPPEMP